MSPHDTSCLHQVLAVVGKALTVGRFLLSSVFVCVCVYFTHIQMAVI